MDVRQKTYFMIHKRKDKAELCKLSDGINSKLFKKDRDQFFFVFHNVAFDNTFVGSQLRNYIALILNCW